MASSAAVAEVALAIPAPSTQIATDCRTGTDANQREDCPIVGYVNSIQLYWRKEFRADGKRYETSKTLFFTGELQTGCGPASADTGPFFCLPTSTSTSTSGSSTS